MHQTLPANLAGHYVRCVPNGLRRPGPLLLMLYRTNFRGAPASVSRDFSNCALIGARDASMTSTGVGMGIT